MTTKKEKVKKQCYIGHFQFLFDDFYEQIPAELVKQLTSKQLAMILDLLVDAKAKTASLLGRRID